MSGSIERRPLRILHVDPEKNWGGGEAQVFGLLEYLASMAHRNDLLTHPNGALYARCASLNVRVIPFPMRNDLDLRPVPRLRRLVRAQDYDIVHFHTKRAHTLALWLPHGRNRPKYVVTRRMDYPERRGWYSHCLYNRRVDGVVAISQAIADLLVKAGVEACKVRRISSGIDARRFDACSVALKAAEVKVIGCLAVLEERKGQRFLLEAAAQLKKRGVDLRYRFAGEGPLHEQLENEAARLGLQDEVRFLGFVADSAEFFAGVDLLVMPSLFEGLGVAALEAMAARRAVVATRVGGLAESVVDEVTGLLVPPANSTALADAIAKLVRAPELAVEMGIKGRERVLQRFTVEQMARQNESYYYELLAAGA